MARQARKKSETGIYHIMLRGINRQTLFEDDEDREKILATLAQYQKKSEYTILGYCLMDNHLHLLMKEGTEPIAGAMKRIGVSYVHWYNRKHNRSGHLFQDRYKSVTINDEQYLLSVLRYIHQNPLKAGLAPDIGNYKWSSYQEYIGMPKITEPSFVLGMFSANEKPAKEAFAKYMTENDDSNITMADKKKLTDDEARKEIQKTAAIAAVQIQKLDKEDRNELLKKLKEIEGLSIRQLARITGLSISMVARAQ